MRSDFTGCVGAWATRNPQKANSPAREIGWRATAQGRAWSKNYDRFVGVYAQSDLMPTEECAITDARDKMAAALKSRIA